MTTRITVATVLALAFSAPALLATPPSGTPTPNPNQNQGGGIVITVPTRKIPKTDPIQPRKPALSTLEITYDTGTGCMTFQDANGFETLLYEVTGTAGDYRSGEVTFSDPSAELNLSPDSYAIQCTDQNGTLYYGEFELTAE